jgi:hypothetical protein
MISHHDIHRNPNLSYKFFSFLSKTKKAFVSESLNILTICVFH